jgi:hypothetical protein
MDAFPDRQRFVPRISIFEKILLFEIAAWQAMITKAFVSME